MAKEEKGLARATTDRLKAAAVDAVSPEKVKAALAFKLISIGLLLIALAGGVDYFAKDDQIHKALSGLARDADAVQVANAVDEVDSQVDQAKQDFVDRLPAPVRNNLPWIMLVLGGASLAFGLRMRINAAGENKGTVVRDVGRMIAAPGLMGIVAFVGISWHGALVVRSALGSFGRKLYHGEMTRGELWDFTTNYVPWAWNDVGAVLLIGVAAIALGFGTWIGRRKAPEKFHLPLDVFRRTALFAGTLCVAYFVACAAVAIASYGGALRVVAWPWKLEPGGFLVTLTLMAFGLALSRTGTVWQRQHDKAQAAKG